MVRMKGLSWRAIRVVLVLGLWGLVLLGAVLLFMLALDATLYVWPSNKIFFSQCIEDGKSSDSLRRDLEDRWALYFRPQESFVASRHFVERLDFNADRVLARTAESVAIPKLAVSGVDVSAVAELVRKVVRPGGYVADVQVGGTGNVRSARLAVRRLGEVRKWTFQGLVSDETTEDEARSDLIDTAVFTVFHDLNRNQAAIVGKSVRNVGLLYKGRSSLSLYRDRHDQAALHGALEALSELVRSDPAWVDAKILYGIALAEDRNEEAAIAVLDEALQQIEDPVLGAEVGLLLGQRLVRQYRGTSTRDAVLRFETHLAALEHEHTNTGKALRSRLSLELADCYGHFLSLLRTDATRDRWAAFLRDKAGNDGKEPLHEVAWRLHRQHLQNVEQQPDEAKVDDRFDVVARKLSVEGYGEYRYAQYSENDAHGDAEFRKAANSAIAKLKLARARFPHDFEVIQNLGLIYASTRFDPDAKSLSVARRLFEQSHELKPADFFAFERLTVVALREALERGRRGGINQAKEYLQEMRKRRPESRVASLLAGVISVAEARLGTEGAPSVERLLELAEQAKGLAGRWDGKGSQSARALYLQFLALVEADRTGGASPGTSQRRADALAKQLMRISEGSNDPHVAALAAEAAGVVDQGFGEPPKITKIFE